MGARLPSFGGGQDTEEGLRRALAYARVKRLRFAAELQSFVRFASISAQPRHAGDMSNCAAWLARHLRKIGLERVEIAPTGGHPIVHAAWRKAPPGAPTILIYGHYDVQPAEEDKWRTPPFDPVIRNGNLHGRGASDDKGQMFAHIKAIESYLKTEGAPPVNLICLFEGEEEIGSPHLAAYLAVNRVRLAADCAIVSDTQMPAPDRPAITYSLRGSLSVELETEGQKRELHSGVFGGAIQNPVQALCEIIARLHDGHGRIAIPGFYGEVREWDARERASMRQAGPSDAAMLREAGAAMGWGEPGYTLYERTTIRPALTVCGIAGGYDGQGVKAAIPARALAKLNLRLAPDQDPNRAERLFREYIAHLTPPGIRTRIRTLMRARPASIDTAHAGVRAAARAYRRAFGAPVVFLRSGGTIPVVSLLHEIIETPVVLMGFGLPDDRIHGPNEKFSLSNFLKGVETSIGFLAEMGALRAAHPVAISSRPSA